MARATFQDLSSEIVANTVHDVDSAEDLKALRLVSKELEANASAELFRKVFLSPEQEVIERWLHVARNDRLANLARHATIWTQSSVEGGIDADDVAEDDPEDQYAEEAIPALAKFLNLRSLCIEFSPECIGSADARYWQEVLEDSDARLEKLRVIYEGLQARAKVNGSTPIRRLTVVNLQNEPLFTLTNTDMFRDVIGNLDELHLQTIQEYNEAGPDNDYQKIELRTWPSHLIDTWLAPISSNLKSLSLYARTDNWGPFPGNYDFSELSFPNLETLALGYYTIAHDDQLDWICSIKTLKRLVLHRCMIARNIRMHSREEWTVNTHDWTSENSEEDWGEEFAYHGVWSKVFQRLASELPLLEEVAFEYPGRYTYDEQERVEYGVHSRGSIKTEIFHERYVVFDEGILPTHWPEAKEDGTMYCWKEIPNYHEVYLEEDQKALDALLELCNSRKSRNNKK